MKHEPAVDRARLVEAVGGTYGLAVESAAFVPVGYAAACYRLECGADGRWFLKLWPATAAGRWAGERQAWVLPLLRALRERGAFPRVAAPRPTQEGALSTLFDGCPIALFPWLDGATPPGWPAWGKARWEALGGAMAAIHGATPALTDVLPPRWSPEVAFAEDMGRALDELDGAGRRRPGLAALREALVPRKAEVLAQLRRLEAVNRRCAAAEAPLVLCHADLGGENILFDGEGQLWALDWDDAVVGPPEIDLRVGVESDQLGPFLRAYRRAGGAAELSRDRFELFLLRRALEDAHARIERLLREEVTPAEAAELVEGVMRWGFGEWRALDARLAALDPHL